MANVRFIAIILTEILAKIVKLTRFINTFNTREVYSNKPCSTFSEILFKEPTYQVSMS